MTDLVEVLQRIAGDLGGAQLTLIGGLTIIAKYSIDLMRTPIIQSWMPRRMRWANWSRAARIWVSLGQGFVLALLPSLGVMPLWRAVVAALIASLAGKGLHDTGVLPGYRPTPEPSPGRDVSIRTRPPGHEP